MVICQEEKAADIYEVTIIETEFPSTEGGDFYQTVGSRSYYLWHKDMDQKIMALKAEIGYYDSDTGERCTLLAYDRQEEFWMNELLAWEDCIVWLELMIEEPYRIMKYDLEKEELSILYESEEDLLLSKWGDEVVFYSTSGINGINVKTGEQRLIAKADRMEQFERIEWSEQVMCYAGRQEDNTQFIHYENLKTNKTINLTLESDRVTGIRVKANENFIIWMELISLMDYSNPRICVYDIQENKCYRYAPKESFLLSCICDNGCLINMTGKEEKLVEWNVKEGTFSVVFEKDRTGYSALLPNGEDEWYISTYVSEGITGKVLIKRLPASN